MHGMEMIYITDMSEVRSVPFLRGEVHRDARAGSKFNAAKSQESQVTVLI
jgi:hypothetical protein